MSTIRISCSSAGIRLDWVRMMSGSASASSRGSTFTATARSAATSALTSSSSRALKSGGTSGRLKSIRASPGSMLPPVTSAPKSRNTTPHSTCRPVWVRISSVRRSSSTAPVTVVPGRRQRIALGRDQVEVVALAGAHDAGLHALPEQHAVVRRLARRRRGRTPSGPARCPARDRRAAPCTPTRAGSGRTGRAGASGRGASHPCGAAYSASSPTLRNVDDPLPQVGAGGPEHARAVVHVQVGVGQRGRQPLRDRRPDAGRRRRSRSPARGR